MNKKYEALFTPWKIGNLEIKNRIVLCPMGGTSLLVGWSHTTWIRMRAISLWI